MGNKNGCDRQIDSKGKTRENVGNGTGDLVTKDVEKVEVLNAFFALTFTGKICFQQAQAPDPFGKSLEQGRLNLSGGGSD